MQASPATPDHIEQLQTKQAPDIEIQELDYESQDCVEELTPTLEAAEQISAARAAPRILKTPVGASKSTNPLFETDSDMMAPHGDGPQSYASPEALRTSRSSRVSSSSIRSRAAAAAADLGKTHEDTVETVSEIQPETSGDACGEGVVEIAEQCSMDKGVMFASPLRPSSSASQPPRSPASIPLHESLPGAVVGWGSLTDHSSPIVSPRITPGSRGNGGL